MLVIVVRHAAIDHAEAAEELIKPSRDHNPLLLSRGTRKRVLDDLLPLNDIGKQMLPHIGYTIEMKLDELNHYSMVTIVEGPSVRTIDTGVGIGKELNASNRACEHVTEPRIGEINKGVWWDRPDDQRIRLWSQKYGEFKRLRAFTDQAWLDTSYPMGGKPRDVMRGILRMLKDYKLTYRKGVYPHGKGRGKEVVLIFVTHDLGARLLNAILPRLKELLYNREIEDLSILEEKAFEVAHDARTHPEIPPGSCWLFSGENLDRLTSKGKLEQKRKPAYADPKSAQPDKKKTIEKTSSQKKWQKRLRDRTVTREHPRGS